MNKQKCPTISVFFRGTGLLSHAEMTILYFLIFDIQLG